MSGKTIAVIIIAVLLVLGGGIGAAYYFGLFGGGPSGSNNPPVASFRIKTWVIGYEKPIDFDASDSYDPDGDDLSYSWKFGDGATGTGEKATHIYNSVGKFTITLTVSDGRGGTDEANRTIDINHNPSPSIKVLDPSGKSMSVGYTDVVMTFDASGSKDNANDIISYNWEFGDGTSGEGVTVEHAYPKLGVYKINLTVADSAGNSGKTSKSLVVNYRATYSGNLTITDLSVVGTPPVLAKDFGIPVEQGSGSISAVLLFNTTWYAPYNVPGNPFPAKITGLNALNLTILDAEKNAVARSEAYSDPSAISLFGQDWKACKISIPYKLINESGYGEWTARITPEPDLLSYLNVPYILTISVTPQHSGSLALYYEGYVTAADSNPVLNKTMDVEIPVVNGTYAITAMLMFDSGVIPGVPMGYQINDLDLYLYAPNGTATAFSNISGTQDMYDFINNTNISSVPPQFPPPTFTYQFEFVMYYAKSFNGLQPGDWKVGISLKQGARVQYWLTINAVYLSK
jgi:PKD repeat protein